MMTNPEPADDTAHAHALALGALGLRVLPIKAGHKRPPMNSWQHAATNDPDKISNWYRGLYRDAGVGLALGPQPNGDYLFAIDIDTHDPTANGWDALAGLETEHGKLPDTWRSLTGAGGGHLIFKAPPGVTVRNQQASGNRIAAGIDVRGDGGQIVVAPTIHPDTGRLYAWEHGYAPGERAVAEAPDWLLVLVREPDPTPAPITSPSNTNPAPQSRDDELFDRQRADWDWHTELLNRGWTHCGERQGDHYWARPGKDRREGHSAVLHGTAGPFVIFTTEIDQSWTAAASRTSDGSGWSFSPFGFYAATQHAGDRSHAAKALAQHYGLDYKPENLHDLIATQTAPAPTEAPIEDDWTRRPLADLARAILNGEHQPELPVHLEVTGGMPLFYLGRLHSIFGPPGGGKTWVALYVLAERLKAGEHVLMIDWEDAAQGTTQRLLQLGCTPDELERFDYRNPSTSLAYGWSQLIECTTPWTLIVMDSAGEALAAQGIELNNDAGTAQWMQLAKRLARRPEQPSVVMLDHVPKSGDEPAKMAIGSQRKLAAITGASYRCDTLVEPAKGKDGKLRLVVAKDRLGNRAKGATACEVKIHDEDELLMMEFGLSEAQVAHERGEKFRPTVLMERISRWLEFHPGATKRKINDEVTGKKMHLDTALEALVDEGYVTIDREGQAHVHTVVKPYFESADALLGLVDNSNRVPASHRVPTASLERGDAAETNRVPRVPVTLLDGTRDAVRGSEDSPSASPVDNSMPDLSSIFGPNPKDDRKP